MIIKIIESYLQEKSAMINLTVEGVECGKFLLILKNSLNFRNAQGSITFEKTLTGDL